MAFSNNYPLGTVQKSSRNAQFPVSPWLISPSQVLNHLCAAQGTMRLENLDKPEVGARADTGNLAMASFPLVLTAGFRGAFRGRWCVSTAQEKPPDWLGMEVLERLSSDPLASSPITGEQFHGLFFQVSKHNEANRASTPFSAPPLSFQTVALSVFCTSVSAISLQCSSVRWTSSVLRSVLWNSVSSLTHLLFFPVIWRKLVSQWWALKRRLSAVSKLLKLIQRTALFLCKVPKWCCSGEEKKERRKVASQVKSDGW